MLRLCIDRKKNRAGVSHEEQQDGGHGSQQDELEIEVQDGHVVLKPHLQRVYRLEDLVKQITPKNLHGETEMGTLVGREVW